MTGRLRDAVLALVVGALAAVGGAAAYDAWRDLRTPAPVVVGDRVQAAADAFAAGEHVYVAADSHDRVPPEDQARLEELAAASEIPVRVAVWEESSQAGYRGIWAANGQLQRLLGDEAVYVIYSSADHSLVDDSLEVPLLGEIPNDFHGDPVRRLEETLTAVGEARRGEASDWSYWGGTGGAIAAGVLFGALAIPVVLVLVGLGRLALGRRFRMVGGWT